MLALNLPDAVQGGCIGVPKEGGLAMAKALKCLKEGCTFEVRGNSVDDVLAKLKMHAMIAHQMPQLPADLIEKAKGAVRDV
jgi:predicted small metal-binding protein